MICCGPSVSKINVDPTNIGRGFSEDATIPGIDDCTEDEVDATSYFTTWSTDSSSVATAGYAVFNGIADGSTTGRASGLLPIGGGIDSRSCPSSTRHLSNIIHVALPSSLSVISVTNLDCPGSANYGIKVDVKYQVLDNLGVPLAWEGLVPYESGT